MSHTPFHWIVRDTSLDAVRERPGAVREPSPVVTEYSETEILHLLRKRGATLLRRVHFRANRSTIWSLTREGTTLNLHVAYRRSTPELLDAFAVIATAPSTRSRRYRNAVAVVRDWPDLAERMGSLRAQAREDSGPPRPGPCAGTPEQRAFLRRLYLHLNAEVFQGVLPSDIPLRLSARMVSRLGQLLTTRWRGRPRIIEIGLNLDLVLEGNDAELLETLAHEMAHAVDYLLTGSTGHGRSWKRWARRAGCEPVACTDRRIVRRRRKADTPTRVPPWPFPSTPGSGQSFPTPESRTDQLDLFSS